MNITPKVNWKSYRKPQMTINEYYRERLSSAEWCAWMVAGAIAMSLMIVAFASAEEYDAEQIADAIYIAEGGERAKKPYGILSVPCAEKEECRKICLNTIHNNFARWQIAGAEGDFLAFLAERYAPASAHPLNKNWLPNLRYYLAREK